MKKRTVQEDLDFELECLVQAVYDAELALSEAELAEVEIEDNSFEENQCHIAAQLAREYLDNAEFAVEQFHRVHG